MILAGRRHCQARRTALQLIELQTAAENTQLRRLGHLLCEMFPYQTAVQSPVCTRTSADAAVVVV